MDYHACRHVLKITEVPWTVDPLYADSRGGVYIEGPGGEEICRVTEIGDNEPFPNSYLTGAAPDLYEALNGFYVAFGLFWGAGGSEDLMLAACENAKTAMDKAKGRMIPAETPNNYSRQIPDEDGAL